MKKYKDLTLKFFQIIENKKFLFPVLILISLINSFIDLLGISMLVPFLGFILSQDIGDSNFLKIFLLKFLPSDDLFFYCGFLIIIIFFLKIFITTYLYFYLTEFSLSFQRELKIKILTKFQNLSYKDFIKSKSHDYFELITNLAPIFANEVLMPFLKILTNLILIFALSILMFITNPSVFLVLFLFLFILITIYSIFSRKNEIYGKYSSEASQSFLKSIQEIIRGYREILIFKKKDFFLDRSSKYSKINIDYSLKSLLIGYVAKYIIEFVIVSFFIFYIYFLYFYDKSNLKDAIYIIIIYSAAAIRLVPSVNILTNSISSINFGLFSIERIHSTLFAKEEFVNDLSYDNKKKIIEFEFDSIRFENIFFNYEYGKTIINNLNLTINKNQIIGISGKSGSGKTTFLNIFLGLLQPSSGNIIINKNISLKENIDVWHSKLSYMPQDTFLINDTIKNNIALSLNVDSSDEKRIYKALTQVDLQNIIKELPHGIESEVGELGVNFSGGQKQRLAISRAIYHNKDILIFDEATSALDSKGVDAIKDLILNFKKDKTILIVSHNDKVLNMCDKIISF
jgi:ABC-type branched-subunit amino acid transport system ATPase component